MSSKKRSDFGSSSEIGIEAARDLGFEQSLTLGFKGSDLGFEERVVILERGTIMEQIDEGFWFDLMSDLRNGFWFDLRNGVRFDLDERSVR